MGVGPDWKGKLMAKQKYLPLFDDQLEAVAFLTDEQLGSVVRAAMRFMRNGEQSTFDGVAGMFYQVLRAQYIRQYGFQQNGSDGGRPRKKRVEKDDREGETPVPLRRGKNIENKNTEEEDAEDEKDSLSLSTAKPPRLSDEDFAVFWEAYPRKESKAQARKAFAKADARLDMLLQALEAQKQTGQWQSDGGRFIPYASTWLNQKRWEDDLPAQPRNDSMPVDGWGAEHPDWSDQSTWVTGPDGIPRPVGVAP